MTTSDLELLDSELSLEIEAILKDARESADREGDEELASLSKREIKFLIRDKRTCDWAVMKALEMLKDRGLAFTKKGLWSI